MYVPAQFNILNAVFMTIAAACTGGAIIRPFGTDGCTYVCWAITTMRRELKSVLDVRLRHTSETAAWELGEVCSDARGIYCDFSSKCRERAMY